MIESTLSLAVFAGLVVLFTLIITSASSVIDDLKEENRLLKAENACLRQQKKR